MVLGITYRDYISFVKGFVKTGSKEYRDRTNAGALSAWPTSEKQIEVFYIMQLTILVNSREWEWN